MATRITNEEWEQLSPKNFETATLLRAVDCVDELRDDLNDGQGASPPRIRTDLLRLHQLALSVINEGSRSRVGELFELAGDLEEQVSSMMSTLEQVQDTLLQLTALSPDNPSSAGLDSDD